MNKKSIEIARSKVRSNHKQVKYLKDVFSGAHFGCGCKFWRATEVEMSSSFLKALLIEKCIILAKSALLLNQFSMLSHSFDSVNWIYTSKCKTSKLQKKEFYIFVVEFIRKIICLNMFDLMLALSWILRFCCVF